MKTTTVETAERGRSPLGAYVRFLMDGPHGNMIHSTVPPGMVGRACRFRTIGQTACSPLSGVAVGAGARAAAVGRHESNPEPRREFDVSLRVGLTHAARLKERGQDRDTTS